MIWRLVFLIFTVICAWLYYINLWLAILFGIGGVFGIYAEDKRYVRSLRNGGK